MTHTPVRECICCRMKAAKAELIRIVKNEEGIFVDKSGKQKGRGAYLCAACLENPVSIKKRPLDRAFRQKVEDEVYEALFGKEI